MLKNLRKQEYKIKKIKYFDTTNIFECGQCFRWNKTEDGTYIGVVKGNVIEIEQDDENIIFKGIGEDDFSSLISDYFDLSTDYEQLNSKMPKQDATLQEAIEFGAGIRILKQEKLEMLLSFIISANNNIPSIKKAVEALSKNYGEEIKYNGKKYYTFPTLEKLSTLSVEDFRALGIGFRDKYLKDAVDKVYSNEINLEDIKDFETEKIDEILQNIQGVGPKVSACVMLFAYHKFDVFPIDTWIKRIMIERYFDGKNTTNKQIDEFSKKYFGKNRAIAQQYLFYHGRESK